MSLRSSRSFWILDLGQRLQETIASNILTSVAVSEKERCVPGSTRLNSWKYSTFHAGNPQEHMFTPFQNTVDEFIPHHLEIMGVYISKDSTWSKGSPGLSCWEVKGPVIGQKQPSFELRKLGGWKKIKNLPNGGGMAGDESHGILRKKKTP